MRFPDRKKRSIVAVALALVALLIAAPALYADNAHDVDPEARQLALRLPSAYVLFAAPAPDQAKPDQARPDQVARSGPIRRFWRSVGRRSRNAAGRAWRAARACGRCG